VSGIGQNGVDTLLDIVQRFFVIIAVKEVADNPGFRHHCCMRGLETREKLDDSAVVFQGGFD
jgi:hypothetical protein